jgi:hypothetical protein
LNSKDAESVYINMGIVLRGDVLRLKEIMEVIANQYSDVKVIYQKTDGSRLKIISVNQRDNNEDDYFTT